MTHIVYDEACQRTVVKNTSGVTKFFSFLPPHGRRLDANETFSFFGDIVSALANHTRNASRKIRAFYDAVEAGSLEILSTPSPVVLDSVTHNPVVLTVAGGSVHSGAPCYETSLSEE